MRRAALAGLVALLAGCGSGGGDTSTAAAPAPAPAVTIKWGQSTYLATATSQLVLATVNLDGPGLPSTLTIDVQASEPGLVLGTPPFTMNALKQVVLTMSPQPLQFGYVRGTWTVTATARVNGRAYSATTTFVSQ